MSSFCAPPPPSVMCCCVMLRAPTHLKHGTPIMSLLLVVVDVCQEVSVVSIFFREAVMILSGLYFTSIFSLPFHPALLRKLCLGNATHPPDFSRKPHALHSLHAHTHAKNQRNVYQPAHLIPALSHPYCTYSETQPLTHPDPTHPLIPPSFFRFPLG